MRYNTGNPVEPDGSSSPFDLHDNAGNIDLATNGTDQHWADRRGVSRLSWAGIEASFAAAQAQRENDFNTAQDQRDLDFLDQMDNMGYELPPLYYAAGVHVDRATQLVLYLGEYYRAKPGAVPFVLTGDWEADEPTLKAVGDAALRSELAGDDGATLTAFLSPMTGAIRRKLSDFLQDSVSAKIWCKGDYYTNDDAQLKIADAWCYEHGKVLDLGDGKYSANYGFVRKSMWKGTFAPKLGAFPVEGDAKKFMRPGYKHLMPGCSVWFSGPETATTTTARTDRFASFSFGIMDDPAAGTPHISGVAFVQDMDVYDTAGNLTSVAGDKRDPVDVLYYATTGWTHHSNHVVFGYPKKAGTFVYGKDVDYMVFDETCSTSGDMGLAICGNGVDGLSGTRYAGEIYANDHHSRSIVDNQWGTCGVYIDGNAPAFSPPQNSIGGHYLSGSIRTYCDNPIITDHCNTAVFKEMVFEWSIIPGSVGATKSLPIFTANSYGIVFDDCRHLNPVGLDGLYQAANNCGGVFIHSDPRYGNLGLASNGKGVFLRASGGNPALQLTADINGASKGWTSLLNLSSGNRFEQRYENSTALHLTTTGTLTANRLVGVVSGSSSATDPSIRLSGSDPTTGFYRTTANTIAIAIGGVKAWDIQADMFLRPGSDNTNQIGSGSFRIKEFFGANNIINTSDGTLKTKRVLEEGLLSAQGNFTDRELAAWGDVRHTVFKWNDSIYNKGLSKARLNVGFIAQEVRDVFASYDLDASHYALWCEDPARKPVIRFRHSTRQKIELVPHEARSVEIVDGHPVMVMRQQMIEVPAVDMVQIVDEHGVVVLDASGTPELYPVPVMEEFEEEYEDFEQSGSRLGLRYEQCLIFETAFLRAMLAKQEHRIAALEAMSSINRSTL
ncbi:tail fiber domain-containing protein [Pseudomonas sp. Irchel 3H3]|uniref:tail fiber domain-containing protein n=1 Tax=Pseudomonas sp. Irchel 3H3 TaxID=2009038 RepID=UPI000BA2FA90|nr:tail fiber domain-containing protein [Pseudomonas sp. Irchel 3H3]